MADDFVTNAGVGGDTFAADDISGVKFPRVKLTLGANNVNDLDVSSANPMPVTGTVTATGPITDAQLRAAAVPVSAASLPLPLGAATEATLAGAIKAEDAVHASGDNGIMALAVRQDAETPMAADGDYHPLTTNAVGRLKVSASPAFLDPTTGNITANGQSVTADVTRSSNVMLYCTGTFSTINCTFEGSIDNGASYFGIQAVRSNANTIELTTGNLSAAPAYAWEMSVNALTHCRVRATAFTSGTQVWRIQPGPYATEPIPAAQISGTQPVSGTLTAVTTVTTVTTCSTLTNITNWGNVVDNAAFTDGTSRVSLSGYIFDETAGTALTENDAAAARVNANRAQVMVVEDGATRGQRQTVGTDGAALTRPPTPTQSFINSAATTNATSVKASAGTVFGIHCFNAGGAAAFVKFYNLSGAPTVGTSTPVLVVGVPALGSVEVNCGTYGHRFATGIALAITNLAADSDATAVALAQIKVATSYV